MVFEDPLNSLDPAFRVGDLIGEALILHKGLSKRQAWKKAGSSSGWWAFRIPSGGSTTTRTS
jgi:ABC-type microcin C transport system duplicated ATPase subunit YejF